LIAESSEKKASPKVGEAFSITFGIHP